MVELRGCEANIIINAASGIQPGNYDSVFYWEQVQEYKIKEVAHFRFTIIRDIYCQEILLSSALVHMCFFCVLFNLLIIIKLGSLIKLIASFIYLVLKIILIATLNSFHFIEIIRYRILHNA